MSKRTMRDRTHPDAVAAHREIEVVAGAASVAVPGEAEPIVRPPNAGGAESELTAYVRRELGSAPPGASRVLVHTLGNMVNSLGLQIQLLERQVRRDGASDGVRERVLAVSAEMRRVHGVIDTIGDDTAER